ncbi:hypothetical protein L1049_008544 [Liquidambar formosana]|uniref:Uncharacterized protein n=1 Tax=Liquidambar formosana TaxID=63359 RepID=A0AAP0S9T9_LIQFO
MGKQTKGKKTGNFGKGKVTPVQVAFIVDRYLSDNNYSQTRTFFRTEASTLISKSPVREAPKSLLSLGAMLDEYICLKEQKVMLDQEKCRLEKEKLRVQTLLQGMQNIMNVYNASASTPTPLVVPATAAKSMVVVPHSDPIVGSSAGHPVYNTPIVTPEPMPTNTIMEPTHFSTPVTNYQSTKKRNGSHIVQDAPLVAKKSRSIDIITQSNGAANSQENVQQFSTVQSSPHDRLTNGSPIQGSSVVKNLFNQSSPSLATNSSGPKTPPQALSSQSEKFVSPLEITSTANSSNKNTPQHITPTNCTIISSETVTVSPLKQKGCYSVERNHFISTSSPLKTNSKRLSKRDHVKGRLDFDGSDEQTCLEKTVAVGNSTSESEKEEDFFDIDLPNLDFSISELLVDFDLDCEEINYSCQPALSSINTVSRSTQESGDANLGASQVFSEYSSTVTEVFSEKDINRQGLDSLTAVKSITKCIKILSPAKNSRGCSSDQENLFMRT